MHTQTLQRLRAEVEAASTLHLALGRIAVKANPAAPTGWTGPLLEELEDLTNDEIGDRLEHGICLMQSPARLVRNWMFYPES